MTTEQSTELLKATKQHAPLMLKRFTRYVLGFVALVALLFVSMDRRIGIYDECFVLTAALRTLNGQVIHRDFYYAYGPAQPALIASLFKVFGISVLAERLSNIVFASLMFVATAALLRNYCRRHIALIATGVCLCWSLELSRTGLITTPCAALAIASTFLILKGAPTKWSARCLLVAGVLDGVNFLFRYDVGLALTLIHISLVVVSILYFRKPKTKSETSAQPVWFTLGFLATALPSVLLYLRVAPLSDFIFDILTYPRRHYFTGRNLPFPPLQLRHLGSVAVYLPFVIVPLGLTLFHLLRARAAQNKDTASIQKMASAALFLWVFSMMAVAMYAKGYVRISAIHLYLCTIPCMLLLTLMYEHRSFFPLPLRAALYLSIILSALAASSSALDRILALHRSRTSMWTGMITSAQATSDFEKQWCRERNRVTEGACFLPPPADIETLNYLSGRLKPGEPLYVGLSHHDRVFTNDNFFYFATGNLPPTRWSQFDPGLQNDPEIQRQMIGDIEARPPSYVILDSSSETENEPNESSKSTGAILLDQYLHSRYRPVAKFETMTILERASNDFY